MRSTEAANPVCTDDPDLPPPPAIDSAHDPARPHPDEPGAPAELTIAPLGAKGTGSAPAARH